MSSPPPGVPISAHAAYLARVFIGVTTPALVLCTAAFATRIYRRIIPTWNIGLDDYFIIAAFILAITDWSMLMPGMIVAPGFTPLDRAQYVVKLLYLAAPVWTCAMTCAKISIALMLLRIRHSMPWKIFLFSVIAVLAANGIGNTLFPLLQCRPLDAAWDFFGKDGSCLPPSASRIASDVGSAVNITTDLLLSLAPITFLRQLNRPLRERILIGLLMSLGILVSICSIMKMVNLQYWGDPALDNTAIGFTICTWTALEELLAVLAACLPVIKPLLHSCLGRMGISLETKQPTTLSFVYGGGHGASPEAGVSVSSRQKNVQDNEEFLFHMLPDGGAKSEGVASTYSESKSAETEHSCKV